MNKTMKRIGVAAGALVLLVILAIVLIPLFVDVQKYKPLIEKQVTQATGRAFTLGGDVRLSLFPWIGVSLADLHLGNPAGFSQKDLLAVESLDVKVRLWPLLSKDIQVKQFVLKGARVVLETRKDGKTGWQDIGPTDKSAEKKPPTEKSPKPASGQLPISSLMVGEFSILDSSLLWLDDSKGARKQVSDIQLKLKDVSLDHPISLDFSAKLDQKPLSLKGRIGPVGQDPGKGTLSLALALSAVDELRAEINGEVRHPADKPEFSFNLNLPDFSPRKVLANLDQPLPLQTADPKVLSRLALKAHIAGDMQKVLITDGMIQLDDSVIRLSAEAKDLSKPNLSLDLKLDGIDLARYLPPAEIPQVQTPKEAQPALVDKKISALELKLSDVSQDRPILLDVAVKFNQQPLSLKGSFGPLGKDPGKSTAALALTLNAANELRAEINGEIRHPAADAKYFLNFNLAEFSPRKLLANLNQPLPVQTADPKVLSQLAFAARIAGDAQKVLISDGRLSLDDSLLNFTAGASEFSKPNLNFNLKLDRIDLDRYLPPVKEGPAEPEEKTKPPADAPAKKTDYGPLRQMVLDGQIQIGKLKVKNVKAERFNLKIMADKGVIRIDPLSIYLYKGSVAAKSTVNVQQESPQTHLGLKINGVQAGPLLMDLAKKDFIEGTLKADLNFDLVGDQPDQIKKNINGKGELQFRDGAIQGIDLAGMVRNAAASFGLAEKPKVRPKTDFAELIVPFSIQSGMVKVSQTSLASPLLRLKAKGDADLNKETIDFRIEPLFVATLVGQGDTQKRSGFMVPVLVSGTFKEPKYRPDLKSLLKQQGDVGKGVETLKKGIQEKLPGKAGDQNLEEKKSEIEKGAKDLIKGLPFGQ